MDFNRRKFIKGMAVAAEHRAHTPPASGSFGARTRTAETSAPTQGVRGKGQKKASGGSIQGWKSLEKWHESLGK